MKIPSKCKDQKCIFALINLNKKNFIIEALPNSLEVELLFQVIIENYFSSQTN